MSFNDCSQVVIHGHAINNVDGNQINTSQTITAGVVNINSQMEKERTEYDEFEEVKRGQIYTLKRHTGHLQEWGWRWGWELIPKRTARRTICTVQVRPDQQTKYTAAIYEGKDAHVYWEEDFRRFSRAGLGTPETWQLYGLNRSQVPLLLFHGELVPLANFYKESFWGGVYLEALRKHLGCYLWEIWLDMRGNLCKGLEGPDVPIIFGSPADIVVPSSAQMLQDDVCFKFFQQSSSSSHLDDVILSHAQFLYMHTYLDDLFSESTKHHPPSDYTHSLEKSYCKWLLRNPPHHLTLDMFDGLRFDTVYSPSRGAIARYPRGKMSWRAYNHWGLVNEMKVDRLIRFKLDYPRYVKVTTEYQWDGLYESWLMQSSRIMNAHEMSGIEERCFIVEPPCFCFSGSNLGFLLTVENHPPIYLFIYPPPSSMSELISWEKGCTQSHFWSLDENGRSEISKEECRRWGVPQLQFEYIGYHRSLQYWPSHIHTTLHNWQVVRGFDPTTANWAHSLGYPELEIIGGKKEEARFEGVQDWYSYTRKLREQDAELQLGTPLQAQEADTVPELSLTTPTPEPSPIPVPNWNAGRKRKLTPGDPQVGHNERSGERQKRRRKKRMLKKPITTPRTNK